MARQSEITFVVPWRVSVTDLVLDVVRALGSYGVRDVWSYGKYVLGVEWEYTDVLNELETLLSEGRLSVSAAA